MGKIEVIQARAAVLEVQKKRLVARRSLSKRGSLLASNALQKIAQKYRKETDEVLQKANTALNCTQNKQKTELTTEGVSDCIAESSINFD